MQALAPHWLRGCKLREIWFEPTFHKHAGKLNHGVQIHCEGPLLRSRRLPAVARAGAGLQGDPPAVPGLPAVARLRLRVRIRPPGHRPDQRLAAAARMGRLPGRLSSRPRRPGPSRRGRLAGYTRILPCAIADRRRRAPAARQHAPVLRLLEQREAGQIGMRQGQAGMAETGQQLTRPVEQAAHRWPAHGMAVTEDIQPCHLPANIRMYLLQFVQDAFGPGLTRRLEQQATPFGLCDIVQGAVIGSTVPRCWRRINWCVAVT